MGAGAPTRMQCRRAPFKTRWGMPRFMDLHDGFGGLTLEQMKVAQAADWAIEAEEGVHFEHAWLDPEAGKVFCLSTGPSKEAVLRIHERAGHPSAEIYELPIEVS